MSLFLSCIFYSIVKVSKNVLQKEIEHIKPIYWLRKPVLDSHWLNIENNLCQILCVVLEFLSNGEGLDCFLRHVLPKLSKVTVTCPQSVKKQIGTVLTCPKLAKSISPLNCSKSAKWSIWNLYISSHGEARNIKLGQQANIIEGVALGTPPQAVVISLAHNHMANLFISSYRGATIIKFGQ